MSATTVTIADFRGAFPEFADTTKFPDSMVQFNLNLATTSLSQRVWGDLWQAGVLYYTAHYVALAGERARLSALGRPGMIGGAIGLETSKSLGGGSISRDYNLGTRQWGGLFNLTQYGQEFLTLAESITTGVLQF